MEKFYQIIQSSPLFNGFSETELKSMLQCLSASTKQYAKNQTILHYGDTVNYICMVLSGSAHTLKEDFWGNQNIMDKLLPGHIFAETFACTPDSTLSVSVQALEPTTVLMLNFRCMVGTCKEACDYHNRLIRNLLTVLAKKNMLLNEKLSHMAQRTTREKLLSYLFAESRRQSSRSFFIPYNRQQLADYLSVDRSAMSNELCKMRDCGILEFDRNHFILHEEA